MTNSALPNYTPAPDVIKDPFFDVTVTKRTPAPNTVVWSALHQCYSELAVADETPPAEGRAGRIAVKRLLDSDRGHFGPLEHPQITFATSYFPHSVMQQARTHRVGVSFDVQSSRYSGERMLRLSTVEGNGGYGRTVPAGLALEIEELIYFRPLGRYRDRQGDAYTYTNGMLIADKIQARYAVEHYILNRTQHGMAEEHARGYLPFDIRQNFVVSFNLRSLMHFLTVRGKKDAQPEIQQLCIQMLPHFHAWSPEFYGWFMEHQWQKGRLAP